ncbi:sphingomyelin phosphodiesterase 1-like [Uranotaenia lowii]|uniref:sphingomyelin phosphodiesterase 1-like n=1 Tax=Uranotaenia lowii TaxID=190385 RepID=UPI0024791302|nr:sphingomyelin phosphodiesterase 1-like [Uranotaenia lowii]
MDCPMIICSLLLVTAIIAEANGQSSPVSCTFNYLSDAERHFGNAFAVGFKKEKMSNQAKQILWCLKSPETPVILSQIPNCVKPEDCLLCRVALSTLIASYKQVEQADSTKVQATMQMVTGGLCQAAGFAEDYCKDLVKLYLGPIIEILRRRPNITANDVCSMAFGPDGCTQGSMFKDPSFKPVTIPETDFKTDVSVYYEDANPIKAIHLTDIHYDPEYKASESGEALRNCKKTLGCCRATTGSTYEWGSYQYCDTPRKLLENSFQSINSAHPDAAFIYVTGDLIRHHLVEVDFEVFKRDAKFVFRKLMDSFPNKPILFAVGNHDTDVFGMFSPERWNLKSVGQSEVYKFLKKWIEKLWNNGKSEEKIQWPKIAAEGYYSVLLNDQLRVVVLNSNVAYFYNWWLLVEHFYDDQLQWLQDVLRDAEMEHEKVHILSHIPPNHFSLLPGWSEQFQRIVHRYRKTIAAQFNGHSHFDDFTLFYDLDDPSKPINVAWNGGSITPHVARNPNYHALTISGQTMEVTALDIHSLDLTATNKQNKANWSLLYSLPKAFEIEDLSPESLNKLVLSMADEECLLDELFKMKTRNGPRFQLPIKAECKEAVLCDLVSTNWANRTKCDYLLKGVAWPRSGGKHCRLQ